jgi:hypothetical protein
MADTQPEAVRSVAISVWDSLGPARDEPIAVATLVEPARAVTLSGVLSPTFIYKIAFAADTFITADASVDDEVPALSLVTLRLIEPRAALPLGELIAGPCVSIWPALKAIDVQQGRISQTGTEFIAQFDHPTEAPPKAGSPIVVEGQLVGVLGANARTVIPARLIVAALHPIEIPDEQLFSLLDGSARRALAHADGMTIKVFPTSIASISPEVHAEHLILGLYENPDGSTRRLLSGRGIDERSLRQSLFEAVKNDPPSGYEYAPARLLGLPPVSKHVREALRIAAETAAANREPRIRGRHLFFGMLSVKRVPSHRRLRGWESHRPTSS